MTNKLQQMIPKDGIKVIDENGTIIIKNGIKVNSNQKIPSRQKRANFTVKLPTTGLGTLHRMRRTVKEHQLHTVCEEAKCPNLPECWSRGTATFMLLGKVCTRACKFCSVDTGNPKGLVDLEEPKKIASNIEKMRIKYAVLTCVDRDDLADGGAAILAQTVRRVKALPDKVSVEILSGDFGGKQQNLDILLQSEPDVFAHNIETVEELTPKVRDPRSQYRRTLDVLSYAHQQNHLTKSSIMVGHGETFTQLEQTMKDLRQAGVSILTIGQYLRPTMNHLPVEKWYDPQEYEVFEKKGYELGFSKIFAGPLVRSSYYAEMALDLIENN